MIVYFEEEGERMKSMEKKVLCIYFLYKQICIYLMSNLLSLCLFLNWCIYKDNKFKCR